MPIDRITAAAPLAVVTGTTHGIGLVTARELARAGFEVLMLNRNAAAARRTRAWLKDTVPDAVFLTGHCDLASLASVRDCAQRVRDEFGPIALLVNNAGIAPLRPGRSADGFELTFATNHLGPFLLTGLLLDRLEPDARIVGVASCVHADGRGDFETAAGTRGGGLPTALYARSKLANVLHTLALARRLEGSGITANCVHPGIVDSNLLPWFVRLVKPLLRPVIFNCERGAQSTLHAALSPLLAGANGRYIDENQQDVAPAAIAQDTALQERLWSLSESLVDRALPGARDSAPWYGTRNPSRD